MTSNRWKPSSSPRGHVYLAEDDGNTRLLLARVLRDEGCTVTEIEDGMKLLDRVNTWIRYGDGQSLAAIVSDFRLPGVTGLEVLEILRAKDRSLPFVLISADMDWQTRNRAFGLGVTAVFQKPLDIDSFRSAIRRIVPEHG